MFKWMFSWVLLIAIFLGSFSAIAQFELSGNATSLGPNTFELTPNIAWQNGAVWYKIRHDFSQPFSVSGQLYFGASDLGADGIVFVVQDNCLSAGTSGGGIGYENLPGNSIGVEFDTYQNIPISDPVFDHIALLQNGNIDHAVNLTGPFQMHATNANVEDGAWHDYLVTYDPSTTELEVYFDGDLRISHPIDIVNAVLGGQPYAYWGFTSATGGAMANHGVSIDEISTLTISDTTICSGSASVSLPPLQQLNVALNKVSNSSTNEGGGFGPPQSDLAFDGDLTTRWSSEFFDPQWVSIDLGNPTNVDSIALHWEAAYATEYKIQSSTDNVNWTDEFHETAGNGGIDEISISIPSVRYLRMYGIQRATIYGYSLWEFEVFATPEYAWTPNDGTIDDTTSANPTFTPVTTTTYSVSVPDQCLGSVSFDYTVFVEPEPTAEIAASSTSGCADLEVNFVNNSINANNYVWSFSNGNPILFDTTLTDHTILFSESTVVSLIASNGTCSDSTTVSITVDICGCTNMAAVNYDPSATLDDGSCLYLTPSIDAPNVITVNGDATNDTFFLTTENVEEIHLVITNRWGGVVFEATGPTPEWDGTANGRPVSEGVYFYRYEATDINGEQLDGHGFVHLFGQK